MCDPTYTLLRWQDHDWPSNTDSLADQVFHNSIPDMEQNSISALYSDFRSPSRCAQRDLRNRKRQRILNPMFRTKHCAYHHHCLAFSRPHISSRQRRWRGVRAECTDDAYCERECAELEVRERIEYADLVALYHNHGHNATVIERLCPQPFGGVQSEEGGGDGDVQDWVSVSRTADTDAESEADSEARPEVIATQTWTLYLYAPVLAPSISPQPSHLTRQCDYGSETTFTFHRNATGIYELGYAHPNLLSSSSSTNPDPYGCTHLPLPLSCGCCSSNAGFFACSCADFPPDWRSPEERWRGNLIEWASGDVSRCMRLADQLHEVRQRGFGMSWRGGGGKDGRTPATRKGAANDVEEWTFIRAPRVKLGERPDWDVVSELSSTGSWRIVDVA